jgi:hypothetical protein
VILNSSNAYDIDYIGLHLGSLPPGKTPFTVQLNNNNKII